MRKSLPVLSGQTKFVAYYLTIIAALLINIALAPEMASQLIRLSYLGACLLMGFCLGIDVALVSISLAGTLQDKASQLLWCFRTAVWHTILPMIGLGLCILCASTTGSFQRVLGVGGALLLIYFYSMFFFEIFSNKQGEDYEEVSSRVQKSLFREIALVWAVSLDSMLFAPALITTEENWSSQQTIISMLGAGLVVGLMGLAALKLGASLVKYARLSNKLHRERIQYWGLLVEHIIVSYFGFYALLNHGFDLELSAWLVLGLAVFTSCSLFGIFAKRIQC